MADNTLTEQQRKWMASVRAGLEKATGRSLAEWVEIARGCPETAPRARQRWFKETHGLGQNHAMMVLSELAGEGVGNPRDPDALASALWSDPRAAAVFAALKAAVGELPDLITGQRKTYTTWSRAYAFASTRPIRGKQGRGGLVRLGLAVTPDADPRLVPAAREGWSERLHATLVLAAPGEVDGAVKAMLRAAWARS